VLNKKFLLYGKDKIMSKNEQTRFSPLGGVSGFSVENNKQQFGSYFCVHESSVYRQ
jgi:hypothetical protein